MDQDLKRRLEFEALLVEHHVRVRAFVRSLGVDPDWVDDLAQEAFLTAFREWESFDETKDFGRWVRGIAANLVRNEIRKESRRRRILHGELSQILLSRASEANGPAEALAITSIRECVEELAPTSRAIVDGRYRDGQSAAQLAIQFETTAANVRQMLVRLRRQVKRCVELRLLREA